MMWELGLLRKRSSSTSAAKRSSKSSQLFTHLIVIDFESTCWKDQKYKTQEIIEFPAVLLDTRTGEIVEEFHHYVQPQENPTLSAFCKQLTGITQEQVDDGIPLNFCLSRFKQWLKKLAVNYKIIFYNSDSPTVNRCTFVTWSDWDLNVCLNYECRRKQLRKPPELNSWIDLRAVYRKFYCRKPKGLNGALKDVGIIFEGREHSGVCDARNTAKLAYQMIRDGCVMMITRTLDNGPTPSMPPPGPPPMPPSMPPPLPTTVISVPRDDQPTKPTMKRTLSAPNLTPKPVGSPSRPTKKPKLSSSPAKVVIDGLSSDLNDTDLELMLTLSTECEKQIITDQDIQKENKGNCLKKATSIYKSTSEQAVDCENTGVNQENNINCLRKATVVIKTTKEQIASRRSISQCVQLVTTKSSVIARVETDTNQIGSVTKITHDGSPARCRNTKSETTPVNPSRITECTKFCIYNDSHGVSSATKKDTKHLSAKSSGLKDITNVTTPVNRAVAVKNGGTAQKTIDACFKVQEMKTPANNQTPNQSSFKTPTLTCNPSGLKRTPPLCDCGRRSNRKMVQMPGPNVGRFFYACPLGKKGFHKKSGCGFFKWEAQPTINKSSPALRRSSIGTNSIGLSSDKVTSHVINGMSYTSRSFESPLPQPNFNTPLSERVGSFNDIGSKNTSIVANGRANTVLKPPMF